MPQLRGCLGYSKREAPSKPEESQESDLRTNAQTQPGAPSYADRKVTTTTKNDGRETKNAGKETANNFGEMKDTRDAGVERALMDAQGKVRGEAERKYAM